LPLPRRRGQLQQRLQDALLQPFLFVGGTTTKPELTPEVMHAKALEYDINQAEARITALEKKNVAAAREAETAYRAANAGRYPAEPEALLPFFATPQQGADWVEFLEAVKAAEVAHKAK
jgi:hypothetical protein